MLGLFEVQRFEQLAEHLRDERLEGMDENNVHRFHNELTARFFELKALPTDLLLEYDQNIVKHTQRLNERRLLRGEEPVSWKYFQYLTLLFTEIYLDRYFRDPLALLNDVNARVAAFNDGKNEADQVAPFPNEDEPAQQLNKLAYWCATGSGKTLLMHMNILQYQYYLEKHERRRDLNRIILLTPNEGLSLQHLREFEAAGIHAELFDKDGAGLFAGQAVEIIDIHKLKDEMGDKTVAVEAFEGNNLVLIDEGHRGASSGETGAWMRFRNALCEKGFSFEYSATFGQAVKNNANLTNQYARCVLMDYSYKYFYGDGFGKDYHILNLDEDTERSHLDTYLVACLLAFFQQQSIFREHEIEFRPFQIEKPLWIFVGSSVNAVRTENKRPVSDVVQILLFLAHFASFRSERIDQIDRVLNHGLIAANGRNLFSNRFTPLIKSALTPSKIYDAILATIFNAPSGGKLHIENIKGATGEIALRLGDNDPFGVINVGDDSKLCTLCDQHDEFVVADSDFSESLFHEINKPHSTVNLLIGSKKFTEGWNSWRVSTMGLMNVGSTEGSQIIQLFGRGVRLKGYDLSLKRSTKALIPADVPRPGDTEIRSVETLNIFGIKADYMAQFRDFLEDEGLPANEEREEFILPVIKNLGTQPLKTIRLKKVINGVSTEFGTAFKKLGPIPTLQKPDGSLEYLQRNQVELNWYPKISAMKSRGVAGGDTDTRPDENHLSNMHIAFLDLDKLYFELQRFKAERAWYNFNISREAIRDLLDDRSWYTILIPDEEMALNRYDRVMLWQEIAAALLKKYCERYYTYRKHEWELPHLEYQELRSDDPNFPNCADGQEDAYYRVLVESSQVEIVAKLNELKALITSGKLKDFTFGSLSAIFFGRHLYQPLLHLDQKVVEISPVPLNQGERRFVDDMKKFYEATPSFFEKKELYLLRNLSKGRGVGFFEKGNFYPDFIVWLLTPERQYISFIDPKGIRNLGPSDPKIHFYQSIKEIENRLDDPKVVLNSFIVSNTPSFTMRMLWSMEKAEMEARHILFQEEDKDTYISALLGRAVS